MGKLGEISLCFSVAFVLFGFVELRKSSSKKDTSSLKKCNLRLELWNEYEEPTLLAAVRLRSQTTESNATGTVIFEQQSYRRPIRIKGNITGLDPSGKHAMFITDSGLRGCNWSSRRSKHYNPLNQSHGETKSCWRHIGDMEVLKADENGETQFTQYDPRIQLQGPTSVIGRSLVILFKSDDNLIETSTRVSCGVIGYARGTKFSITRFKTPKPENGLAYVYIGTLLVITLLSFIWFVNEDMKRKNKEKPVFDSDLMKQRHRTIVYRHRKVLSK